MNWNGIKNYIIYGVGVVVGFISFFDLYPLAIALYAAALINLVGTLPLILTILPGIALTSGIINSIKYGVIMVILYYSSTIALKKQFKYYEILLEILSGLVSFMTCIIFGGEMFSSVAEGILIASITVILSFVPFNSMPEKKVERKPRSSIIDSKNRLSESAEVFSKLAQCFSELPFQKSNFGKSDFERMSNNIYRDFCISCPKSEDCWETNYLDTEATCELLFSYLQKGVDVNVNHINGRLRLQCLKLRSFMSTLRDVFDQSQIHLFWYNRLIEHREAVAGQLNEMATMISEVAMEVCEETDFDNELQEYLNHSLRERRIKLDKLYKVAKRDGREEYYISMHAIGDRYVSVKTASEVLSRMLGKRMVPSKESRHIISSSESTVMFVEKPMYRVICKAARATKTGESISGDNYMFLETENGEAIACISDGMGSGFFASNESETVVELMEHFIEAGFSKETAVKMINSTMVLSDGEPSCSTMDICSINLYDGSCEFVKLGAAATYLKREHWIEQITGKQAPVGVVINPQYEHIERKLFDGDYIIMVSDGVIDAAGYGENLDEIIKRQESINPMELANAILTEVLGNCNFNPSDDMTVLVLGVWKN